MDSGECCGAHYPRPRVAGNSASGLAIKKLRETFSLKGTAVIASASENLTQNKVNLVAQTNLFLPRYKQTSLWNRNLMYFTM